jgi:hypothetical protein
MITIGITVPDPKAVTALAITKVFLTGTHSSKCSKSMQLAFRFRSDNDEGDTAKILQAPDVFIQIHIFLRTPEPGRHLSSAR